MKRLLLAVLLAIAVPGCFGTETGNPSFALVSIDAHSSDPGSVSIREESGAVVVDQAWVVFGAVGLVPEGGCPSTTGAIESAVLGPGDHSEPGPLMARIDLADTATFCGLVAPFAPSDTLPPTAPPELAGRTVVLLGHLADGTEVKIVSAFQGDVIVAASAGSFTLESETDGLFVGLDMAEWVSSVDLAGATREPDGSIVLDDTSNTALRDALDARIPEGVELYRDDGADGVPDPVPVLIGRGST